MMKEKVNGNMVRGVLRIVIASLVIAMIMGLFGTYLAGKTNALKIQELDSRVVKLEKRFQDINQQLKDISVSIGRVEEKLDTYIRLRDR